MRPIQQVKAINNALSSAQFALCSLHPLPSIPPSRPTHSHPTPSRDTRAQFSQAAPNSCAHWPPPGRLSPSTITQFRCPHASSQKSQKAQRLTRQHPITTNIMPSRSSQSNFQSSSFSLSSLTNLTAVAIINPNNNNHISRQMCGCCGGQFCPPILANLLNACRRAKMSSAAKKAAAAENSTLLTPYEVEQLPLMLREVERANRHFWQMVCWRMEEQRRKRAEGERAMKKKRGGSREGEECGGAEGGGKDTTMPQKERTKGVDDSYADGCALRELVRTLAKCLCEKDAFDEEAERMLADYRARLMGEQWGGTAMAAQQQQMKGGGGTPKGPEGRRREFAQKGRAISFNGGLEKAMMVEGVDGHQQKVATGKAADSSGSSSSSSGYASSEGMTAQRRAASWLRQRAHSVRSRSTRRCSCQAQQRIAQLGELLGAEFHSTVYAHPEQFDVHERELKVLVWRRFVHLLVALLIQREQKRGGGTAGR